MPNHREKSLETVLQNWLQESGMQHRQLLSSVLQQWPSIAGPGIASQTRRLRFEQGELVVYLSSPVWLQEFELQKSELLKTINYRAGKTILRGLRGLLVNS